MTYMYVFSVTWHKFLFAFCSSLNSKHTRVPITAIRDMRIMCKQSIFRTMYQQKHNQDSEVIEKYGTISYVYEGMRLVQDGYL